MSWKITMDSDECKFKFRDECLNKDNETVNLYSRKGKKGERKCEQEYCPLSKNSENTLIKRKMELIDGVSEEEREEMKEILKGMGIYIRSEFEGDDNYFVVGFENEVDLYLFELSNFLDLPKLEEEK